MLKIIYVICFILNVLLIVGLQGEIVDSAEKNPPPLYYSPESLRMAIDFLTFLIASLSFLLLLVYFCIENKFESLKQA